MKKISELKVHSRAIPLLMVAILVLTACQGQGVYRGYQGEDLPQTEVAGLLVPEKFNLLYIDDHKYEAAVLSHGTRLELLPGKHQLVIEYDELWDISSDDHERITSQAVLVGFSVRPGRSYILQSRQLKDVSEARAYAKKPEVKIIEQASGQSVSVTHEFRLADKSFMAGFNADIPEGAKADKRDKAPRMLEYWWLQSDYTQQQDFLNWAKSHSKSGKE